MDKKELKFYDAPACEVVELKASVALLAGSVLDEREYEEGETGGGGGGVPGGVPEDGF